VRILVTGAGGQLGTALRGALSTHEAVFLGHADLDITDFARVREAVRAHAPDLVLNAAAYNQVDAAEADPQAAYRGNALGPHNLAVAAEDQGSALLHVSTDYVFDGRSEAPYTEESATLPLSLYGWSKLRGEEAVRSVCRRHFIVRTAWVYATRGKNFPLTILARAEQGEVRVVDDQVGCPTYAPHLARGLARLLETDAFGTHHMAGGGSTSWYGLTRALFDRLGVRAPLVRVKTAEFPRPARRPARVVLTSSRPGGVALPGWESGLAEFARDLRSSGAR
jgi:dTDP-4-dehydrorhamnose reductase